MTCLMLRPHSYSNYYFMVTSVSVIPSLTVVDMGKTLMVQNCLYYKQLCPWIILQTVPASECMFILKQDEVNTIAYITNNY